ncbi:uncharacterized protein LOC129592843 isoform X1 [Paramacrobiotus metropolitanus]|uniref:uncharacterized protein LOC129592843 isoform X1 n=1 Tax=Paramacrobiotus metropolitanus TaxID=2943436 RepID=UPI0024457B98|nr:uncharacterized protein LOC129592843 isoform X1 [Paramacrobiotus metropolitanus]
MEFLDLLAQKRPQRGFTKRKRPGAEDDTKPEAKKVKGGAVTEGTPTHPRFAFTQNGKPVYRFCNDKFVYVGTNTDAKKSTIRVVFGEWKEQPDNSWKATWGKNIVLSKKGFLRLAALMLAGKSDMDKTARASSAETGRLTPLYLLDGSMYFGWSRFSNANVATIRRFNVKAGDMVPTRCGISFGERCYDGLKELLKDLQLIKDIAKIQKESGTEDPILEGLAYTELDENIADALVPLVKLMDDGTGPKNYTENYRPSDAERNGAVERLQELRIVHGILFGLEKLGIEQALEMDVESYLMLHENRIRGNVGRTIAADNC